LTLTPWFTHALCQAIARDIKEAEDKLRAWKGRINSAQGQGQGHGQTGDSDDKVQAVKAELDIQKVRASGYKERYVRVEVRTVQRVVRVGNQLP
jgi:hypothetical protein